MTNISIVLNNSINFFKENFTYFLIYSLIFILVQISTTLLDYFFNINFLSTFITFPLSFSIQYFTNAVLNNENKSVELFFKPYKHYIGLLSIKIIEFLIILICLVPIIVKILPIIVESNYNLMSFFSEFENLIKSSNSIKYSFFFSILLIIFTIPFYFFTGYLYLFENYSIINSFQKAYQIGVKNYLFIIVLLLTSFFIIILSMILTCGLGFLLSLPFIYVLYYFGFKQLIMYE